MYLSYLGVRFADFKFTGGNIFGITLLLSPYIVWTFVNELRPDAFSKRKGVYISFAIAMPIIGFGMVHYTLLFPDAQNAFLILYIPFMQFMCLGVAWAACKKWNEANGVKLHWSEELNPAFEPGVIHVRTVTPLIYRLNMIVYSRR